MSLQAMNELLGASRDGFLWKVGEQDASEQIPVCDLEMFLEHDVAQNKGEVLPAEAHLRQSTLV